MIMSLDDNANEATLGKSSATLGNPSGTLRHSSGRHRKSTKKSCGNDIKERHLSCYFTLVRAEVILMNESFDPSLWDRIFVLSLRMHTDTTPAQ